MVIVRRPAHAMEIDDVIAQDKGERDVDVGPSQLPATLIEWDRAQERWIVVRAIERPTTLRVGRLQLVVFSPVDIIRQVAPLLMVPPAIFNPFE